MLIELWDSVHNIHLLDLSYYLYYYNIKLHRCIVYTTISTFQVISLKKHIFEWYNILDV